MPGLIWLRLALIKKYIIKKAVIINKKTSHPKYLLIAIPERVRAEIIMLLIKTPKDINGKDTLNGIPIIKEAVAPAQLPVKGKGKAVKETKPIFPYFFIPGKILFLVLEKIHRKNFSNIFHLMFKILFFRLKRAASF